MSLIDQITTELCVVRSDLSVVSLNIVREQSEVARTMEKAQCFFGDQFAGQELVKNLYASLQNLIYADSSLYALNRKIQDIENDVRK